MSIAPRASASAAGDVEAWLAELGLEPLERADREGVTSWDLVLDGTPPVRASRHADPRSRPRAHRLGALRAADQRQLPQVVPAAAALERRDAVREVRRRRGRAPAADRRDPGRRASTGTRSASRSPACSRSPTGSTSPRPPGSRAAAGRSRRRRTATGPGTPAPGALRDRARRAAGARGARRRDRVDRADRRSPRSRPCASGARSASPSWSRSRSPGSRPAVGALPASPAAAANTDLTLVTNATYTVQPTHGRVHVVVAIDARNHRGETRTHKYYFDHAFLAVQPGASGFAISGAKGATRARRRSGRRTRRCCGSTSARGCTAAAAARSSSPSTSWTRASPRTARSGSGRAS